MLKATRDKEPRAHPLCRAQSRLHLIYPNRTYLRRSLAKHSKILVNVKKVAMSREEIALLSPHQLTNSREEPLVLFDSETISDLMMLLGVTKQPLFVSDVDKRLNKATAPLVQ